MIADCNIKVNGRWIRAGEEYTLEEAAPVKEEATVEQDIPEPVAEVAEEPKSEPKAEAKPRSTTRRKKISE